jgi:hypothetical protein
MRLLILLLLPGLTNACERRSASRAPAPPPADSPSSRQSARVSVSLPADSAAAAVYRYLVWARDGAYDSAAAVSSAEPPSSARWWFPRGETLSTEGFLRESCRAGLFLCDLTPDSVLTVRRVPPDIVLVTLELVDSNGHRFEQEPCCGSTGPPQTAFTFHVLKTSSGFRVLSTPIYQP